MKYINKLFAFASVVLLTTACTVNDPMRDIIDAGEFLPTVYWDIVDISVTAGNSVNFTGQYYSTMKKSQIDHLEVWYSLDQTINKTAKCPLFIDQGLIFEQSETESTPNVRPSLLIQTYPHDEGTWDNKKAAYQIKSSFPVSYNLGKIVWGNQRDFDQFGYEKYFEDKYLENFRDSLYTKMNGNNFMKLLTISFPRLTEDEFKAYSYNVYDPVNKDSVIMIKPEYVGEVKALMYSIPPDSLLYDNLNAKFLISYDRSYKLNAKLKVIDKDNHTGVSETRSLTIN